MVEDIKRAFPGWAGLLIGTLAIVMVANQLIQFAQFARSLHPVAGDVVSIGLVVLAGATVITPIVIIVRLPKALVPPVEESDHAAVEVYQNQLRQRLSTNPNLSANPIDLSGETGLKTALQLLDARADQLTRQAASTTLYSATAISQNGRLDAMMVLAARRGWSGRSRSCISNARTGANC